LQGRLGALADTAVLILGLRRQNVQGQPTCEGLVTGLEFDARIHGVGNEGDVPGQPVELGDQQGRLAIAGQFQSLGQLGPV
jgi:hypothetical protein